MIEKHPENEFWRAVELETEVPLEIKRFTTEQKDDLEIVVS